MRYHQEQKSIVDYVLPREGLINSGNVLTIALDGSTGSTFYQHHPFSSGQNIWILSPRPEYFKTFSPLIAIFLVTTIKKAVESYTWNLSLTKTRLSNINIYLPIKEDETVDTDFIINVMKKLRNIRYIENIPSKRYSEKEIFLKD